MNIVLGMRRFHSAWFQSKTGRRRLARWKRRIPRDFLENLSQTHPHPYRHQPEQYAAQSIDKRQPYISIPQ